MISQIQSRKLSHPAKNKEVRKVERQRDLALARIQAMKATKQRKKLKRRRQRLANNFTNLMIATSEAVARGEL